MIILCRGEGVQRSAHRMSGRCATTRPGRVSEEEERKTDRQLRSRTMWSMTRRTRDARFADHNPGTHGAPKSTRRRLGQRTTAHTKKELPLTTATRQPQPHAPAQTGRRAVHKFARPQLAPRMRKVVALTAHQKHRVPRYPSVMRPRQSHQQYSHNLKRRGHRQTASHAL